MEFVGVLFPRRENVAVAHINESVYCQHREENAEETIGSAGAAGVER